MAESSAARPQLDPDAPNSFLYALHYKVEAIEKLAIVINDSITDHAVHIEETRPRATRSFTLVSDEINKLQSSAATGESDTRTVMRIVQENDDALKASITSVVQLVGQAISTTESEFDTKVKEIQTAVETMHQRVTATATATATGATATAAGAVPDAPPGLPFHQELAALMRRLDEHERNPAHLLDPEVLKRRLPSVETSVATLSTTRPRSQQAR